LEEDRHDHIHELKEKNSVEGDEFRKRWQSPAWLAQFQRPSPVLLQMRYIEKKLALSKQYDEAKAKGLVADKQQRKEEREIEAGVELIMQRDFVRMKEAQSFALRKLNDHFDILRAEILLQKEKEVEALEYALKQMDIKKQTTPNRKLHAIPKALTHMNELETGPGFMAKTSPRTASKMAVFRHEVRSDLTVRPPGDGVFKRLARAHPVLRPASRMVRAVSTRTVRRNLLH
jgi:hypothetical protein